MTACTAPSTVRQPPAAARATPPPRPPRTPSSPAAAAAAPPTAARAGAALVLVLGAMTMLGPLTIDMYLPALPAIADNLHSTAAGVQLTLTGTLAGVAVGQLLVGPLSDAFGRRRPLLLGMAVHVAASLLAVLAPTVEILGALRVLQGFGAAAASVVAMAVVRDLFTGRAAAVLFSRLMLVVGVAPVLAPSLGSALLRWTDWRGIFAALGVVGGLLMVLAATRLPETLPPHRRRREAGPVATLGAYRSLFADRTFVGLMLVAGLMMGALFAYVSGSSFVFQEQFGLDEQQFGVVFSSGAIGLIAATQLNARLLRRYAPVQLLTAGLGIGAAAALLLVVVALTGAGGLVGILVPLWLVLATVGITLPNVPAVALARHGAAAGTAAALLGAVQSGLGALVSPLVGVLGGDGLGMALVVAGCLAAAVGVLAGVVRPGRLARLDSAVPEVYAAAH